MQQQQQQLTKEWLSGGFANAMASAILNPFDVAKTRAQLRNVNLSSTFRAMYSEGGVIGLWSPGLVASCMRELLSSGPRAGFYVPTRDLIIDLLSTSSTTSSNREEVASTFSVKCLAAMTTGTLGSLIANPIDVVKIRLMANPHAYSSTLAALPQIATAEGISGLYKGVLPSTLRGAFIAAGELATYDHTKSYLKTVAMLHEGFFLHSLSSLITGIVAATVAAPFDIVKTRVMNSSEHKRPLQMFVDIVRKEGPLTLFRGWLPSYLRLGPHAMICFPVFEQLRRVMGLSYL
jgi:hypothetical protein